MTDNNLSDLCPQMQVLAQQCLTNWANAGLYARITVTWRDAADQNEAKAEGLSNACANQSPHNCVDENGNPASKAIDWALFEDPEFTQYITDGTDQRYSQAGFICEAIGLRWGGRWKKPDYDHAEMINWNS